jgi:hypothetical protein
MEITMALLKQLRPEIEAALADLGEKYGIGFEVGSGSYNGSHATLKLEIGVLGDDGKVVSKEAENFKFLAPMYGLSESDLGRQFLLGGKRHTIVGINPNATRFPILTECGGKKYKVPVESVKRALSPLFGAGKEGVHVTE